MITVNINVTKIPRENIFEGKNGKYVNLTLIENKNGPDQYGNHGFVALDVGKEARERGERGPILGNWKNLAAPATAPKTTPPKQGEDFDTEDDIPF